MQVLFLLSRTGLPACDRHAVRRDPLDRRGLHDHPDPRRAVPALPLHRLRQRILPHLDRQPAADHRDPGLVPPLGQGATPALLSRQHPRRRPPDGVPRRAHPDAQGQLVGGSLPVGLRLRGRCLSWSASPDDAGCLGGDAGLDAVCPALSNHPHQLAGPALRLLRDDGSSLPEPLADPCCLCERGGVDHPRFRRRVRGLSCQPPRGRPRCCSAQPLYADHDGRHPAVVASAGALPHGACQLRGRLGPHEGRCRRVLRRTGRHRRGVHAGDGARGAGDLPHAAHRRDVR